MDIKVIDVIIFILIISSLIFAIKNEKNDFCWRNDDYKIIENDTLNDSLSKMEDIIKDQTEFPKWRRSLIMSIIISISLCILLFCRIEARNILIIFYVVIVLFMLNIIGMIIIIIKKLIIN